MAGFRRGGNNFVPTKGAKTVRLRLPNQVIGVANDIPVSDGQRRAGQFDLVVGRGVIGPRRRGMNALGGLELFENDVVLGDRLFNLIGGGKKIGGDGLRP